MLAEFLLFGLGVVEAVQSLLSVPVFEAEREPVVGIVTVECGQGLSFHRRQLPLSLIHI